MKIAICDDEELCRSQTLEIANAYAAEHSDAELNFSVFSSPLDLIDAANKIGGYDIYILDVVMPRMNGIELGEYLRDKGFDGRILYLTSSEEYAIDSFKVKAFNYILKPVTRENLFKAMDDVRASIAHRSEKSFILKTRENSIKLTYDSVLYAELNKRSLLYHVTSGRVLESTSIRTSFQEATAELLDDDRFVACGNSTLVNLHHVTAVEKESITFKNGEKLFLSRKVCSELRSAWYDFWFDGEDDL